MGSKAGSTGGAEAPAARQAAAWRPACGALAVLLLVPGPAAAAAMSTLLPVWWATAIGNQVGGDPAGGIAMGMAVGFAFTLAPLLVAWPACAYRAGWPWKAGALAAVLLLAAPNLLTLGICFGASSSARQARRILGAEAAWFTLWTLYSAIAAALVFTAIVVLWAAWRRRTVAPPQITRRG